MGLLQRLFGIEKRSEDAEVGSMISADEVITSLISGGEQITEDTAMEIPAFSAAVDFVAGTIAMLPIKLCDDNAKEQSTSENADDYRLSLLNDETGDLLNSHGAKYAQVRDMLCGGAGYMYINRNGSQIRSLHYVSRADISVIKSYDPIFKTADIMVSGKRYSPFDFVILARKSADGVTGTGIVEEHKTILSAMFNALKYESIVSKTGGNKKGFLTSETRLDKPSMRELKEAWQEVYANNESRAMVLNKGVNFIPSGSTAVEMQMNESKETNSAQIAAMFGLSPQVISGEAPESVYMSAVRTAIMPIVAAYQEALNRALLLESEKPKKYFVLDTTELLRGDILTRYNAYAVGLANNFLQIDEVRYKEDLKPLGLNFVKLDLSSVLLNPNDNTVYTPNTNRFVKVGEKPLDNSLESGIMEERARHYTKGAHGYFTGSTSDGGEGGSGGSSSSGGKANPVSIHSFDEFAKNPTLLSQGTPRDWYEAFVNNGFTVRALGNGSLKGIPFNEGGGYRVFFDKSMEKILMYHPEARSHHKDAYYKLSSGKYGIHRFNMDGTEKKEDKVR